MKNFFLLLFLFLLVTPIVSAEGRGEVTRTANNTLEMDYDEEIRGIQSEYAYNDNGDYIYFLETDRYTGVKYEIIDDKIYFFINKNPRLVNTRLSEHLYFCFTERVRFNNIRPTRATGEHCPRGMLKYDAGEVVYNERTSFVMPKNSEGVMIGFRWFLGSGAGGGGSCSVLPNVLNVFPYQYSIDSSYLINTQDTMTSGVAFQGTAPVGCTGCNLFLQYRTAVTWTTIPSGGSSNFGASVVDCNGVTCGKTNPVHLTAYNFNVDFQQVNSNIDFQTYFSCPGSTFDGSASPLTDSSIYSPLAIDWEFPTPDDESSILPGDITLNLTTDYSSRTSTFIDFNGDLMSYFRMDHYNSTTLFDNSTHGIDAEMQSGLTSSNIIPGIFGNAINFTDENDYLELTASDSLSPGTGDFSWSFWINPRDWDPSITTDDYLYSRYQDNNNRFYIRFRQADNFQFYSVIDGTARNFQDSTTNPYIQNNEWTNVIAVFNRTDADFKIYVNGVLAGDTSSQPTSVGVNFTNTGKVALGSYYKQGSVGLGTIHGAMDETLMFNRVLSMEEILNINDSFDRTLEVGFDDLSVGDYFFVGRALSTDGSVAVSERSFSVYDPVSSSVIVGADDDLLSLRKLSSIKRDKNNIWWVFTPLLLLFVVKKRK